MISENAVGVICSARIRSRRVSERIRASVSSDKQQRRTLQSGQRGPVNLLFLPTPAGNSSEIVVALHYYNPSQPYTHPTTTAKGKRGVSVRPSLSKSEIEEAEQEGGRGGKREGERYTHRTISFGKCILGFPVTASPKACVEEGGPK